MILAHDLKGWALHFDVPTLKSLYLRADAYGTTTFNGNQSYLQPKSEHQGQSTAIMSRTARIEALHYLLL